MNFSLNDKVETLYPTITYMNFITFNDGEKGYNEPAVFLI